MNLPSDPPIANAPARRRRWLGWLAAAWLLALAGLDARLPHPAGKPAVLDVDVDASVASIVQVFFDTGKGFNPTETATLPVAAGPESQTLSFTLPTEPVQAIRLDPLTVPGTIHLHRAAIHRGDNGREVRALDVQKVTALHEIERLTPRADGMEIVTTPDSSDSQVNLPVGEPVDTRPTLYQQAVHYVGVDVSATLIALLALGLLSWLGPLAWPRVAPVVRPVAAPVRWLDRRFAAWAAALSRPEVVRMDRWVFWFYAACALVFGGLAAAGFHGSSLDEYSSGYPWSGVKVAPLVGKAREIRSDEWALHTPAVLNQLYRKDKLQAERSAFGGENAALLISLPCRDFTQVFRPEFWAFHVLPPPAAFAVYWQCKGFILLTGTFSLLLLLTRGHSGLAALGALWLFFSAHVQWAYSWTSLLPEMFGFFGWTICLTLYFCVGRNRWLLTAAAVGCAISALDFALCFYPPHQIPFVLFGALLVPVWLWGHRTVVFRRDLVRRQVLALAACWGVVLLALTGFYLETRHGIATAAATVYPGQRVSSGGGIPVEEYLSQFLDFWKTEAHFPAPQGNVCEGTGFLWLLPITLVMLGRRRLAAPAASEALLAVCWLTATVVAAWTTLPIPPSVGHWLLFDHVPAVRCLPALGLVNVVGVILYLSLRGDPVPVTEGRPGQFWRAAGVVAIFLGGVCLLALMNTAYRDFFRPAEVTLAAIYLTGLAVCLLERRILPFAAAILLPLALTNGPINPLDRGLRVVTKSPLFKTVQAEPRLREGRWLVYSHDFTLTGFVVATGADVFNSFKVLPDLRAMALVDGSELARHAYNQSGHLVVRPLPPGQPSRFENPDVGLLRWSVSPLDPTLRRVGIRFLAFDEPPDAATVGGLTRIAPDVPGVWIYELP